MAKANPAQIKKFVKELGGPYSDVQQGVDFLSARRRSTLAQAGPKCRGDHRAAIYTLSAAAPHRATLHADVAAAQVGTQPEFPVRRNRGR